MAEKPGMFSKVIPVVGDLLEPNFGLDDETLRKVENATEIFFHMAASSRVEASLQHNVLHNLVGTKTALTMARNMKQLVQMVHLSTAFCNVEAKKISEKVYELKNGQDPEDLIRLPGWMSDSSMAAIQGELLGQHPNTYTYTKRLAEILVQREYPNLPVSIVRPVAVLPSYAQPIPGWNDSLNGIPGIFQAFSRGVLRSIYLDSKSLFQFIPVDTAVNTMVMIPKVLSEVEFTQNIPVYHLRSPEKSNHTFKEIFSIVRKMNNKYPVPGSLWYPVSVNISLK